MRISHFFIDRPRFASVVSTLILIFGIFGYISLPVSQYPEIAPPQVQVTAVYPGANAETVASTVATPLEQEINGVENMMYMFSQATNDGAMSLTITFEPGTDLDTAQVLVQNRVAAAEPRLPEAVRSLGVNTVKRNTNMLLAVNLFSPDGTFDQDFIGNYAVLNVRDRLKRIEGVGDAGLIGASEYAMRIWLDPDKMASFGVTASDVVAACRSQNVQVAAGILNQSPISSQHAFELNVETQGRLIEAEEFERIIVKSDSEGFVVHLGDIARVNLGVENYLTRSYLGTQPSVVVTTFLLPGSNALDTAERVKLAVIEMEKEFPAGLDYKIIYNPTSYVADSITEVFNTLVLAGALVILVIIVFLQSWRTAIIPVIAIPISLVGTFALMLSFGYSLNMLSLFGLVLAIGIVVDDAIVVVENVERKLREGMEIVEATKATMDEVGTALIATSLVLVAVFLPTVLMDGISGQFYKQFGVTIAAATVISTVVSLSLSPALATLLMNKSCVACQPRFWNLPARTFNNMVERLSDAYGHTVGKLVRRSMLVAFTYLGLVAVTGFTFSQLPTGFIPQQDQGYGIIVVQLPPGASLDRTDTITKEVIEAVLQLEDVDDTVAFSGRSPATDANASNAAAVFAMLKPLGERRDIDDVLVDIRAAVAHIDEAFIVAVTPPPVSGIGNAGGFKMMVQDQLGRGPEALERAVGDLTAAASQAKEMTSVFTLFETSTPRVFLDIDRERASRLMVPIEGVLDTLQIYLGSMYVNDLSLYGRSFRITAQADGPFRQTPDDVLRLRVRNRNGQMVPIGSLARTKITSGPSRIPHYNLFPAASVAGSAAPGYSSGQAISRMEELAEQVLPVGFSYEWTDLAYQEKRSGNTAIVIFALAVLMVFLLLTAQYESWTLPLAIVLIVPMCVLSASIGLVVMGMDNNILTQIGLVVLIGLAAKNAILIVEFAKQNEEENGLDRWNAAIEASKTRLRPILMTACSFILGVMPLLFATGAGFEMRRAIGLTVFSGMLGVTLFGLVLTPVFYVLCRKLALIGIPSRQKSCDTPCKDSEK